MVLPTGKWFTGIGIIWQTYEKESILTVILKSVLMSISNVLKNKEII